MAGQLTIDTLKASSGVLATQNGMTGIAKAWGSITGGSSPVFSSSFNVSSITRNGTGDYTIAFTTAMSNANYCITGSTSGITGSAANMVFVPNTFSGPTIQTPTTTNFRFNTNSAGTFFDPTYIYFSVMGA